MTQKPKQFIWSPDGKNYYVRRKGRYTPLSGLPGSEAFDASYWSIMRGLAAPSRTTWDKLIESYQASDRWLSLRTRTRQDYQGVIDYLMTKNSGKDATRTKRADVLAAMEANRHRTRFANYIPPVMSVLLEHAIDLGWLKVNPAKGIRRLAMPEDRKAAHVPWPDDAVAKFRSEARPLPRLIFEIGVGTVQRPADWCRFQWEDFDGKGLRIVQSKTGTALYLPCTAALLEALGQGQPDQLRRGAILRKRDGDPMSYRTMHGAMLIERKRLGLMEYDLHALRYRGVQELARAGCTDEEIASYSGHASLSMIRQYSQGARQEVRADQAAAKRNG